MILLSKPITEKQAKRLYAMAKARGWSHHAIRDLLKSYDPKYEDLKDVRLEHYGDMIEEIERYEEIK